MKSYTIISDGQKVNFFDNELRIDLSLKDEIMKYCFSTIVNRVGVFITSNDANNTAILENYFEKKLLNRFCGPVIFVKCTYCVTQPHTNDIFDQIYILDKQDNIIKGILDEDFVYITEGVTVVLNKGLHYAEVTYCDLKKYERFIPYFIRFIEGLIIECHLKLGYFPVHASVIKKNNSEIMLILGNSQAGKSTTTELLCRSGNYTILSDDIAFMTMSGDVVPYGQYCKVVATNQEGYGEKLITSNGIVYRNIRKIESSYNAYKIKNIILPQIVCGVVDEDCIRKCDKDRMEYIAPLLSEYPNQWFLYSKFNDLLSFHAISQLNSITTYKFLLEYNADNQKIAKRWEEICYI